MKPMFESRGLPEYRKPFESNPVPVYTGVAKYASLFETTQPIEVADDTAIDTTSSPLLVTPQILKDRRREKILQLNKEKNELLAADYDPKSNAKSTENPYLTLFVGRLSYDTDDKKLRREFEQYGVVNKVWCKITMNMLVVLNDLLYICIVY